MAPVEPNAPPPNALFPVVLFAAAGCPKAPVAPVAAPKPPPPNPLVPAAGCAAAPKAPVAPNVPAGFAPNAVDPPPKAATCRLSQIFAR